MSDLILTVTDATFDAEVIQSARPVLVYFYADWSEECRYIMAPVIATVAKAKGPAIQFAALDVDANPRTAMKWAIASVPTLILFVSGRARDRIDNVTNGTHLSAIIEARLEDFVREDVTDLTDSVN